MITYSGNTQEHKNNSATDNNGKEGGLLPQNKLQEAADSSMHVQQLKAYQAMADTSSKTAQREAKPEEELVQGKFTGIQREAKPEEELVQGKFTGIQREAKPEEELVQGKFTGIQREAKPEEELVQGKFNGIQREAKPEEELVQGKFTGIQREAKPEEELMQGKFTTIQKKVNTIIQRAAGLEEEPIQGKFDAVQRKENNTGMPNSLKSGVENLSGMDMSDVKVHYNSDKPAQMQALAYAQGNDIHIGPGQEQHLPHEAWHVVQQRQGRVQPTMQMKGTAVNDDPGLEHEADVMGAKAVSEVTQAYGLKKKTANLSTSDSTIQRITTTTDSIVSDLVYDYNNGQTLFRNSSYTPFMDFANYIDRTNEREGRPYNHRAFTGGVRNRVLDGRIPVNYQRLSTETLLASQGLITWLSSAHTEHMWINDGAIKVARRNAEKKPHPTLAGGDPDVTGAGLFTINTGAHTVTMNNRSGHFRPPAVDQASRDAVTTALTGTGYALI